MGKRGFTMIELMIVALIMSALGIGISIYMKKSSVQLRSNDQRESVRSEIQLVENLLKRELQQIAFINPSCSTNAPTGLTPTADCAGIKVRAGFTPYPGESQEQMDARSDLELSDDLEDSAASLSFISDAARYVLFDFDGDYQCPLDEDVPNNPSSADFELSVLGSCTDLEVGRLYVIIEELGGRSFSNLFQITALAGGGASPYTITTENVGLFNQENPLGSSAFTSAARIIPVQLVELAVSNDGGLFRRQIRPDSSDLNGYGDWTALVANIEGLQFTLLTVTTTDVFSHNRTLENLTGNPLNNGVEDIRGVSPRVVVRSSREDPEQQLYDNPLTAVVENDHFPRQETNFYINFKNTNN